LIDDITRGWEGVLDGVTSLCVGAVTRA